MSEPRTLFERYDPQVTALLEQMTLAEKIGQLVQFSGGNATGPDNVQVNQHELAAQGYIGAILNMTNPREINALQRTVMEKSRLKIPLLFGLDVIHGFRTIYPIPLGMAASWNPGLAERCARMAALETTAQGVRWTFSPMVDIARDGRWGRIMEGNGEDPHLGAAMTAAWVRGYQGPDLADPTALLACAKHYVAYGAAEGGRDYNTVDVSERVLREIYLPPFQAAVEAGAGSLMSAFNTLGGIPASANRHTLTEILRGEWGFQGFVVSDWNSIGELIAHGVALDGTQAAFLALTAGVDMDMQSNYYITRLAGLVESGRLEEAVIDQAVRRVLRVKFALNLFAHPYVDETQSEAALLKPEYLDLAQEAAEETFVLLKNERAGGMDTAPILPLRAGQKIALIGALADSPVDMFGGWMVKGQASDLATLRQALPEAVYARGEEAEEAVAAARQAEVVVMALGETGDMSGESRSRTRLDLPGNQLEVLRAVAGTGKPIVVVLFSGRPLAIPEMAALEGVKAILAAWFPGVRAGLALRRVLFGEVSPSGRLPVSFPRAVGQLPLYYNHLSTGRPPDDPKRRSPLFVTGYIDEVNAPLYPFGWGLTYTQFRYAPTRVDRESIRVEELEAGAAIGVEATVTNTGERAGEEVVQLYISQRGASVARPVRELKGFAKIALEAGEARTVRFTLTKKELAFWNIDLRHGVEPGELTVWVAPHAWGGEPAKLVIA